MLEKFQDSIARGVEPIPLAKTLGFSVVSVAPGAAFVEIDTTAAHANPVGSLHGGVLCAIADSAMGIAHATTLGEGEVSTTVELKINFLRPVWKDHLRAEGRVVKGGKTLSLVECDIFDSQNRLVARSSCTMMTLREGR